jgi:hypothetical protein
MEYKFNISTEILQFSAVIVLLCNCQSGIRKMEKSNEAFDLRGTWIQNEFKDVAINSKSAVLATQEFDNVGSCLNFTENSVPFSFGILFDSHVGGGSIEVTKYLKVDSCYYAGNPLKPFFKLKLSIVSQDTFLVMKENPKLSGVRFFSRISKDIVDRPFNYIFKSYVFSGRYDAIDSARNLLYSNINLGKDGSVLGFGVINKYEIETDYSMQTEDLDMIYLEPGVTLEYEFRGINIYLYERIPKDEGTTKRGPLRYILERKD